MAAVAELLAKVRAELGERHLTSGYRCLALGSGAGLAAEDASSGAGLALDWPGLEELLPGGALPGGVVELASPGAHPSTTFAVRAVRAAHARDAGAWCAWIDPERTLYAPGLLAGGVDLARLLVVAPPRADLGRVAVKLVGSGAFDVVAVDMDAIGASGSIESGAASGAGRDVRQARRARAFPPEVLVRKLALAAEDGKTHVLLLTAAEKAATRAASWPVGMRLDLSRTPVGFAVTIAKARTGTHGRIGAVASLPLLAHQVAAPSIVKAGVKAGLTRENVTVLRQRFAG
jgi:hypothetical protein